MNVRQRLIYILLVFLTAAYSVQAQMEDEANIEFNYSVTPMGSSIGMQTFTFSMPIYGKELERTTLYAMVDYGLTSFAFDESINLPSGLRYFHSFTLQLGALRMLEKNWTLGSTFTPTLNTNFKHTLVSDDI